jgi:hypothetical protein
VSAKGSKAKPSQGKSPSSTNRSIPNDKKTMSTPTPSSSTGSRPPGVWQMAECSMKYPRYAHFAVPLADGIILIGNVDDRPSQQHFSFQHPAP